MASTDWDFIIESTSATEGYWKITIRRPNDQEPERNEEGPIMEHEGNVFTFSYVDGSSTTDQEEWNSGVPSSRDYEFVCVAINDGTVKRREVVPVKGSGGGGPGGTAKAKVKKTRFIRSSAR